MYADNVTTLSNAQLGRETRGRRETRGQTGRSTVFLSPPPPVQELAQAVPSADGPDLYSISTSADGTQSTVQALKADGQQQSQVTMPAIVGHSVPDGSGGLIVTTCASGNPMTVVDLNAVGQPMWEIQGLGVSNGSGIQYLCGPPQIAVRGDGVTFVVEPSNAGLPSLTKAYPNGGIEQTQFSPSTITKYGRTTQVPCCSGPPMVNTDGIAHVEYEIRTVVDDRVTSDLLYLYNSDHVPAGVLLSSTTQNEVLLPGPIIPDGQGGLLATWTISPVNPPIPPQPNPHTFQASHVVGGAPGPAYDLPFDPHSVDGDNNPFNKRPLSLVLGENGVAFAKGFAAKSDGSGSDVDQISSFNVNSGAPYWKYQDPLGRGLSLIVSLAGNGLVVKATDSSNNDLVMTFDSTGSITGPSLTGAGIDYFVGNLWTGVSNNSLAELSGPLVQFSTSGWFSPEQEKSNRSRQPMHVTNASSNGPNQVTIASVFGKIKTALDANPQSTCSTWMQGTGTDASLLIQSLLTSNNFGHGTFNQQDVAAFTYGVNPDNSPVGIPNNFAITVNDNGAFFNSSFVVGIRNYAGNGIRAQGTILIHELSHLLSHANNDANLFQDDFGIPKAQKWNNTLVDQNCRTLIEGLQ